MHTFSHGWVVVVARFRLSWCVCVLLLLPCVCVWVGVSVFLGVCVCVYIYRICIEHHERALEAREGEDEAGRKKSRPLAEELLAWVCVYEQEEEEKSQ